MRKTTVGCMVVAAGVFLASACRSWAYTATVFDASTWPRTDASMNLPVFSHITDFESTSVAQLGFPAISVNTPAGSYGPTSTLPFLFDPATDDPNAAKVFSPGVWDGSHVLINRATNNVPVGYVDNGWGSITLTFGSVNGPPFVGFSLEQNEVNAVISFDGVPTFNTSDLFALGGGRQGYVVLQTSNGNRYSTITISNSGGDGFAIDHLAVFPEPTSMGTLALTTALLLGRQRRRRVIA
jgi:hypothetical protein